MPDGCVGLGWKAPCGSLQGSVGLPRLPPPFPVVEGLKDLLVGPGVELLLTAREPALPGDLDSGGSTSPGVTASECLGWGHGGGWEGGPGPGDQSSARALRSPQMVRPEPSTAPLSSAEPTRTPAGRWASRRCERWPRAGGAEGLWTPATELWGTGACDSRPCLSLQDRNGNQLRAPQEVRWEAAGGAPQRAGLLAEKCEPSAGWRWGEPTSESVCRPAGPRPTFSHLLASSPIPRLGPCPHPLLCPQEALQRLVNLYGLLHGLQVSGAGAGPGRGGA